MIVLTEWAPFKKKRRYNRKHLWAQSEGAQKRSRRAQNFFKHGKHHPEKSVIYSPLYGETLMFDAVLTCSAIFGSVTPLMRAFATRFVIEQKGLLEGKFSELLEGLDVDNLSKINRAEYASKMMPLFERNSPAL